MALILVIDDDDKVRDTLLQALDRHSVIGAENGRRGLEIFHRTPFDLVITDIVMPEMDGIAVIRELRRRSPRTKILAISGGNRTRTVDYLRFASELGADGVLEKPFAMADLYTAIEKCMAARLSRSCAHTIPGWSSPTTLEPD
jgi:YesN/AraC family two-component response regulator